MKKEILLSIIIGFGIGLIATFGVYNARKSLKEANQFATPIASSSSEKSNGDQNTQANHESSLNLSSPLDESITKELKVTVSGATSPSSWVTIISEKGEKLIQADKKGNFQTDVSLISGENEIEVTSFSQTGEKTTKTVTVVNSTAEI